MYPQPKAGPLPAIGPRQVERYLVLSAAVFRRHSQRLGEWPEPLDLLSTRGWELVRFRTSDSAAEPRRSIWSRSYLGPGRVAAVLEVTEPRGLTPMVSTPRRSQRRNHGREWLAGKGRGARRGPRLPYLQSHHDGGSPKGAHAFRRECDVIWIWRYLMVAGLVVPLAVSSARVVEGRGHHQVLDGECDDNIVCA